MENNTEDKILSMNNTNEVVNNLQNSISGLELQISELQNENKTLTRTVKILTSEARRDEEIHRKERRDEFIKMSSANSTLKCNTRQIFKLLSLTH